MKVAQPPIRRGWEKDKKQSQSALHKKSAAGFRPSGISTFDAKDAERSH